MYLFNPKVVASSSPFGLFAAGPPHTDNRKQDTIFMYYSNTDFQWSDKFAVYSNYTFLHKLWNISKR